MDDLAFLARAWEASPPASVSVAKLIATAMSDSVVADEPAEPALPVVSAEEAAPMAAVHPSVSAADVEVADLETAADVEVADLETATDVAVADLETAADLAAMSGSEPVAAPVATDGEPQVDGVVEQVRALFAEAVTAEIPVQTAA
jgi:hypothetical protein